MKTLKPLSGRHIWYLLGIAIVIVSAFKGWEFIEAQLKESHPLNQGMLVYFDFDGNVADGSGRQSRAIIRKATYTDGKFGQGLLFKGDPASYVELPHPASLSNHDALTFAAWANVYSNMAWYSSLFYISSGEEPTHPGFKDRVFSFWPTIRGGVRLTSTPNGALAQATCEAPSESYQHKKFVHFAGVIDALNQQMRIYINGEKVAQCPYPGSQIRDGLKPIRIGGYYRTVAEESGLTGVLDEVRVYNRALSDADIQELFLFVP